MPELPTDVRLDKWLWAARVFKTRSLAIDACHAGHVKVGGHRVKPARSVRVGEIIEAQVGELLRIVKVRQLRERRVGAAILPELLEDLTPPAEKVARPGAPPEPLFHRPKGSGRPTKRERRLLERMGFGEDLPPPSDPDFT